MKFLQSKTDPTVINMLQAGLVAVLRTDTLYGIVARADVESAVERVFHIKNRQTDKRCIILIGSIEQLYDAAQLDTSPYWPGPNSIIIPSPSAPYWLLRGEDTLAYRMPDDPELRDLLLRTGPLIAPSANPEGSQPAASIQQAHDYFGDQIDVYIDGGDVPHDTPASRLIRVATDGTVERLR